MCRDRGFCRVSLVATLVLVAAACGGGDDDRQTSGSVATDRPPVPSSAEPSPSTTPGPDPATTTDTTQAGTATTSATTTAGVVPEGFETVAAVATAADGTPCELCVWVAATDEQRRRGLMGVTDLGPADAMVFVFDEPTTTAFTMRNTLIPLSIAFYGADGRYLDAFDMEPCTGEPCPSYPTPADFTVAVEVPQGNLEALGMEPGSVLALSDEGCPRPTAD